MSKIKYFRNFILCGDLNYRCLLCKVNFLDVTDVDKHLRWEKHKKALNKTTCMPRFRKDSIFKLQSYYYCSFCNRTMQDIEETKQHIESDIHKNQKSHPKAATTRVEVKLIDDVICINNTQISHLQWNGIIDKHCLLCNVVVNNLCSHPYSEHHMVKLIQARVNCVGDKYYRKTDKHTFQCFTCKKTFSIYKFDDHFMNHSNNNSVEATNTANGNVGLKKEVPIVTDKNENPLKDCTISKTNGEHGNAGIKKEVPIVTVKNGNPLKDCTISETNGEHENVGIKKEVPIVTDKDGNPLKDCTISETNGEHGNVGIKKEVPIVTDKNENPLKDCTISETNGEPGNVGIKKEVPIVTDKDGNPLKDCTMSETNGEHPTVLCGTGMAKIQQTEWDIQMLAGLDDDFFNIEMEAKKVSCKDCKKDIKICQSEISTHLFTHGIYNSSFSRVYKVISQYIEKNYIQRDFDYGAAKSKAAQYGKVNYIKMNAGGSKGYCTLCDKFIVASIEVFKVHVAGGFHKGHLELKGIEKPQKHERVSYKSVAMVELIKSLLYSADKKIFLINGDFLINEDSFFLMKRIEHGKYYKKTKCFACDETLLPEDEKEHCISWKHKSNFLVAKVISKDRLPIREVRPRLYHCGVCNETLPYWESLKRHSKQLTHIINYKKTVPEIAKKFGFSKPIVLNTNNDNLYMQLLNAVFNTKYVIKLES